MLVRSSFREIRQSLGRYIAIIAIVGLGVGFFCGLRMATEDMIATANKYLNEHSLYDYIVSSELGYDEDSVKMLKELNIVTEAEGAVSWDALVRDLNGETGVFKALSITDKVNTVELIAGRMPEAKNECLLDAAYAEELLMTENSGFKALEANGRCYADVMGQEIVISADNDEDTLDAFEYDKFKIVGLVSTPLYLNAERGTTNIGDGTIEAFFYIDRDAFTSDYYTEIDILLDTNAGRLERAEASTGGRDRFSSLTKDRVRDAETVIKEMAIAATNERYFDESDGYYTGSDKFHTYITSNENNSGFSTFDDNAGILINIDRVFPVFFILIAALVCMTTMTRMVDDQRTEIGVLKALGYSNAAVSGKYLFYSGSASAIGAVLGYAMGIVLFPVIIWRAYCSLYTFDYSIKLLVNNRLAIWSLIIALACSMGATWLSCAADFNVRPAELIRPKAPKAGKRILLERIRPVWNRISFLYKVSIRNLFRYKKRFLMMVFGIAGCTALIATGLGIRTTIGKVTEEQYTDIIKYDYLIAFSIDMDDEEQADFEKYAKDRYRELRFVSQESVDLSYGDDATSSAANDSTENDAESEDGNEQDQDKRQDVRSMTLLTMEGAGIGDFFDLHYMTGSIAYPEKGEIALCRKYAKELDIKIGDTVVLSDDDTSGKVVVSAFFDNYMMEYGFVSPETYEDVFDKKPEARFAYICAPEDSDDIRMKRDAAYLARYDDAVAYSVNSDLLARLEDLIKSLNYVVLLVILSAAVLAFVVIYNLTNINITERIREIATIKVLGFYRMETSLYVLRENIMLTVMGAILGLPLGKVLLNFVIDHVRVENIFFVPEISPRDYVIAAVLTLVFAVLINIIMSVKLERISMTESLKAVE